MYIMANRNDRIYTGVTNDLERRVYEHKQKLKASFTSRYNMNKLVYHEETNDISVAITREKQIKGWRRVKKVTLIETHNPEWDDLAKEW